MVFYIQGYFSCNTGSNCSQFEPAVSNVISIIGDSTHYLWTTYSATLYEGASFAIHHTGSVAGVVVMNAAQYPKVVTGLVGSAMMVWYAEDVKNTASGYVGIAVAVVGTGLLVQALASSDRISKRRRLK
jgi:hypothetical protein